MAKIQSGLFGPVSGKIGGTVGAVWKGIPTMRTKPVSVSNPNTAGQQAQRGKFASVVAVARLLLSSLIQPYWDPFSRKMSGYNAFVRSNIGAFDADGLATPASFNAARGSLLGLSAPEVDGSSATTNLVLNWTDNTGQADALGTDIIRAVCYNSTQDKWSFSSTATITRADETGTFVLDNAMEVADDIEVYVFAVRADTSKISDSQHLTFEIV